MRKPEPVLFGEDRRDSKGSVTVVRIAHFTDASVVGVNGIASSIGLLTRTLRGRGHDCVVVSAGPLWGGAGDNVIWVPSVPTGMGSFRFVPFPLAGMRDRAKAWRPDVVHVHTPGHGASSVSSRTTPKASASLG